MQRSFSFSSLHLEQISSIDSFDSDMISRFETFLDLLIHWNKRINLVRYLNNDDLVSRHFIDSLQLYSYLPSPPKDLILTDLGSGGGFPGVIMALLGFKAVHLVESNTKKCAFLYEAISLAPNPVHIHNTRIESIDYWPTDIVTARALSSLDLLLHYITPFLNAKKCLPILLKGSSIEEEIECAERHWIFDYSLEQSISGEGSVLRLFHVEPKNTL